MFDTHAHLDFSDFDGDRDRVIERARAAGIAGILTIGIDPDSAQKAGRIAAENDGIWAAAALHPNSAQDPEAPEAFRRIREMILAGGFAAVGETGMDLYRDRASPASQEDLFRKHIELALETEKPLIIHCRRAEDEVRKVLEDYDLDEIRVVMHCFGGSPESALLFAEKGFFISFAGNLTYKNARNLREAAARVPADRVLSETDCPFLAPVPFRGKRNEPALMAHTVRLLADCRKVPEEELRKDLERNALAFLFGGGGRPPRERSDAH